MKIKTGKKIGKAVRKRIGSLLLCAVLVLGNISTNAYAETAAESRKTEQGEGACGDAEDDGVSEAKGGKQEKENTEEAGAENRNRNSPEKENSGTAGNSQDKENTGSESKGSQGQESFGAEAGGAIREKKVLKRKAETVREKNIRKRRPGTGLEKMSGQRMKRMWGNRRFRIPFPEMIRQKNFRMSSIILRRKMRKP